MKKMKIGIIGTGVISGIYMKNLTGPYSKVAEVKACTDLLMYKAEARAAEFNVPVCCSTEEMLADEEIELIVCLTNAPAHASVCKAALLAGKHVYTEKPFSTNAKDSNELVEIARERNLRLGNAPETFLGAGLQTCRKLVDDGWIGEPISAVANMRRLILDPSCPEWVWKEGAGPMYDMGPYYITALLSILGSVDEVCGFTKKTYQERVATLPDGSVKLVHVDIPTLISGVMKFKSGVIGTITTTFDVWDRDISERLEINGKEGTIVMPDPNGFGGPVKIFRKSTGNLVEIPYSHDYSGNCRGLGVAEMIYAIHNGKSHRAHGDMGNHTVDIISSIHEASKTGVYKKLSSTFEIPAPMPTSFIDELCINNELNK